MMTSQSTTASTFTLGGGSAEPITIARLGFGGMQLTGPGIWGLPDDVDNALAVLRAAVDAGVDFIDTADSYGPHVNEYLIKDALYPYDDVTIATKGGLLRTGPNAWHPCGVPNYLRQCVELSLRRLGVERIDLWQLHRVDSEVSAEAQFEVIAQMQQEGKILHVGLSEVNVPTLQQAQQFMPIASVQNLYNVLNRASESVLQYCEEQSIAFIPWFPLGSRRLTDVDVADNQSGFETISRIAAEHTASAAQVALAWLLQRSPVMIPIPGTKSVAHLVDNMGSANVQLSDSAIAELNSLAG